MNMEELAGSKRFPLKDAYAFAEARGLSDAAHDAKDMEIEWDRTYTSTVRRGRITEVFDKAGVLEQKEGSP